MNQERPNEDIPRNKNQFIKPLFDAPLRPGDYWGGVKHKEVPHFGDKKVPIDQYFSDTESLKPILNEAYIKNKADEGDKEFALISRSLDEVRENPALFENLYDSYISRYGEDVSRGDFRAFLESSYPAMARNVLLDRAKVGEHPFSKEFYEQSPLIRGVHDAEELVVILDAPIGNSVLYSPLVLALEECLKQEKIDKPITVVTRWPGLFRDFEANNPNVHAISDKDLSGKFEPNKKRCIFNLNEQSKDPKPFGLTEDEFKDEKNALQVHYSAWSLEQRPDEELLKGNTVLRHYYPLPARVMRNSELFLGTKLFPDIQKMKKFWPPIHDYEKRSEAKRAEFGLEKNDVLITVSFCSSITPKEYAPERWRDVFARLFEDGGIPENAKLLVIQDPDPKKAEKYKREVLDQLPSSVSARMKTVKISIEDAPLLMKMSSVVITPDTGFGHIAASVGTPNVIISLANSALWSSSRSKRLTGEIGTRVYREGKSDFDEAWDITDEAMRTQYLVPDRTGKMEGITNIPPERVAGSIRRALKET